MRYTSLRCYGSEYDHIWNLSGAISQGVRGDKFPTHTPDDIHAKSTLRVKATQSSSTSRVHEWSRASHICDVRTDECVSDNEDCSSQRISPVVNSSRYKTELCRPFEEHGHCKYGDKCQFAHGAQELRNLARHPKYKTELCRTYHTVGFCPYGPRCHFVHNDEDYKSSNVLFIETKPAMNGISPALPCQNPLSTPRKAHVDLSRYSNRSLNQLSISLGSSGDYSPPSSLSASPVLSPTYSDEIFHNTAAFWPRFIRGHGDRMLQHNYVNHRIGIDNFGFKMAHDASLNRYQSGSMNVPYTTTNAPSDSDLPPAAPAPASGSCDDSVAVIQPPCESPSDRLPIFRRLSVEDSNL